MALTRRDLDAGRMVARARALIRRVGLEDGRGGLIATSLPEEHALMVQEKDGPFRAYFAVDEDGYLTQDTWFELVCYILSYTDIGGADDLRLAELP